MPVFERKAPCQRRTKSVFFNNLAVYSSKTGIELNFTRAKPTLGQLLSSTPVPTSSTFLVRTILTVTRSVWFEKSLQFAMNYNYGNKPITDKYVTNMTRFLFPRPLKDVCETSTELIPLLTPYHVLLTFTRSFVFLKKKCN